MKKEVFTQLLHIARTKHLGHFYILQSRGIESTLLEAECLAFIRTYWEEIEGKKTTPNLLNHPDLLVMKPLNDDNERRDYLVDDLKPLTQFLSYHPIQVKRRFVVMTDVQTIGVNVANRLLKTLEEPEGEVTFLWLNATGTKLLPTLESRAQMLFLTDVRTDEHYFDLIEEIKLIPHLSEFIERFKAQDKAHDLLNGLLHFESLNDGPGALKQELLEITHNWQKAQMLNQPMAVRLVNLYEYCQKRFCTER